jgi:ribulose-phosphate 3-epimerase
LDKVREGRRVKGLEGLEWVVDGGLKPENLHQAVGAGADTLVIGRAVFKDGKILENMAVLRAGMN